MVKIKIPYITLFCLILFFIIEPTAYLLLILLSILLHEAGHIIAMGILGEKPEEIILLPFGIDMKIRKALLSYPREIIISLAGACVNLLVFLIFHRYVFFAYTNLLYAVINLIPARGLDGGAALEACLLCFLPCDKAGRVSDIVSFFFIISMWAAGVYILMVLNGNISIFALSVFLFISINMK